jgi:biopolymer transport protein ExbD
MAKRSIPEINAGSMADIAFLLLIFFLVTTTIDSDKGLQILLPQKQEKTEVTIKPKKRNVLNVLVNGNNQLLVRGQVAKLEELTEEVKKHVSNNGISLDYSESPRLAIVSIKNDRGTSYEMYIKVQNELLRAYNELRDEKSQELYGVNFENLGENAQKKVKEIYPQKISEAEPENVMGDK